MINEHYRKCTRTHTKSTLSSTSIVGITHIINMFICISHLLYYLINLHTHITGHILGINREESELVYT